MPEWLQESRVDPAEFFTVDFDEGPRSARCEFHGIGGVDTGGAVGELIDSVVLHPWAEPYVQRVVIGGYNHEAECIRRDSADLFRADNGGRGFRRGRGCSGRGRR